MPGKSEKSSDAMSIRTGFGDQDGFDQVPGRMFEGVLLYADFPELPSIDSSLSNEQRTLEGPFLRMRLACNTAKFAGARLSNNLADLDITHVLAASGRATRSLREIVSRSANSSVLICRG